MVTSTYNAWVVEGSNGQILHGPGSFEDSIDFIWSHEKNIHSPYSAEHPMPDWMVIGQKNTRLGYLLRKIKVTESWSLT